MAPVRGVDAAGATGDDSGDALDVLVERRHRRAGNAVTEELFRSNTEAFQEHEGGFDIGAGSGSAVGHAAARVVV
jgi:hypothetical protein